MFPYTDKYTESEYDIQNNNLLYTIDQQCQNAFDLFGKVWIWLKRFKQFEMFMLLFI